MTVPRPLGWARSSLRFPRTTGRTVRHIYRCRQGHTWRLTFQEFQWVDPRTGDIPGAHSLTDTEGKGPVVRAEEGCPTCGLKRPAYARVEGTRVEGMVCNESCQQAVGPLCRCSCGGERHGEAWDQGGDR